jgi:hypothetical protein
VKLFPWPTAGPLRPVVQCQTLKYNMKSRVGRGFTLEELKVKLIAHFSMKPAILQAWGSVVLPLDVSTFLLVTFYCSSVDVLHVSGCWNSQEALLQPLAFQWITATITAHWKVSRPMPRGSRPTRPSL